MDRCEFEASPVYVASSRLARVAVRCLKKGTAKPQTFRLL